MDEFDRFLGADESEQPENDGKDTFQPPFDEAAFNGVMLAIQVTLENALKTQNQFIVAVTRMTEHGPNVWSATVGPTTIMVDSLLELVNAVNRLTE